MLVLIRRFTFPQFLPVVILGGHYSSPPPSSPLKPLAPLNSYSPPISKSKSNSVSDSETVADSAALLFAPYKSMPAYYHHRRDTHAPGCRVDFSQRSIIDRVAIYCATVFCLLVTDLLIPSKPDPSLASSNGR